MCGYPKIILQRGNFMKPDIRAIPDFDDFVKALRLQPTERLHQFDFNISNEIKEAVLGRKVLTAKDEVEFWQSAGYDYVQVRLMSKVVHSSALESEQASVSVSSSHGLLTSMNDLNKGGYEWSPFNDGTWNVEDYDLDYICEIADNLPDNMKLMIHAADIYTRSWMAMGFEDFCYALYEDEELIEELFRQNYIEEQILLDAVFDKIGDKIGAMLYSDDLAYTEGLMVSAETYRRYLFPYLEKLFKRAKDNNLPIIYHTDGRLWDVFDDFKRLGVNGIQPLEPKSFNFDELKEKRGKDFCLMGSIDLDIVSRGTKEDVRNIVLNNMKVLGHDGGFIVGVSNTVPKYVNVDNYVAMIETARNFESKK